MVENQRNSSKKLPGSCIFCGRIAGMQEDGITVSMSKQHLWPAWVQKEFPIEHDTHTSFQVRMNLIPGRKILISPQIKTHNGDIKSRKLRIVCAYYCNNGWISAVENSLTNFFIKLAKGEKFILGPAEQEKLASWLAVSTVVWEYTDLPTKAISSAEISQIYKLKSPPSHWSMWIGRYKGVEWRNRYRHNGFHVRERSEISSIANISNLEPNSQTTSLQIGELYMHISSSTVPRMSDFEINHKMNWLHRIWPPTGVAINWPPIFTLNDAAATSIADRIAAASPESLKSVRW